MPLFHYTFSNLNSTCTSKNTSSFNVGTLSNIISCIIAIIIKVNTVVGHVSFVTTSQWLSRMKPGFSFREGKEMSISVGEYESTRLVIVDYTETIVYQTPVLQETVYSAAGNKQLTARHTVRELRIT